MTKLNNPESFANQFIDEYLRTSFGSMSKKELEILIFKLILKDRNELTSYNRYELSKLFKIPESKIKTIYNEMQLREDEVFDDVWFKNELKRILSTIKFEKKSEKIILQIENPLFKSMFENLMRKEGFIIDYSFNKDIIKVNEDGILLILNDILSLSEKEEIVKKILKTSEFKNDDFNKLLKTALENFVKNASSKAGEKFTEYSLDILSNGITNVIKFIKNYTNEENND